MNTPVDDGSLTGMAMLGKTAAALAFIIAVILLATYLLKRFNLHRNLPGQRQLHVVSSIAVGQRERVVVVKVEETWLVLGVGGGQVNKLHELPAPEETPGEPTTPNLEDGSFASRFGKALKHNLAGGRDARSSSPSKRQR